MASTTRDTMSLYSGVDAVRRYPSDVLQLPASVRRRTIVFLSDTQYPAIHESAWESVLIFVYETQPTEVWFLGDGIDFPMLTTHFPVNPTTRRSLQADLDGWNARLAVLHDIAHHATRFVYLLGNHEDRLQKYLWHQAPELSGLRGLELTALIPELSRWEVHQWKEYVPVTDDFFATHGDAVSSYAGATAKKMIDRTGTSGIIGHTHRLGASVRRVVKPGGGWRNIGWWENGCIADDRKMDWTDGHVDWQLGFSIGTFEGERFAIEQCYLHDDGSFYRAGVRYG